MKLSNLVNTVRMHFREVENFIRYPFQTVSRIGMRRLQDEYEQAELPVRKARQSQNQQQEDKQYNESQGFINNGKKLDNPVVRSDIKDAATVVNIAVAEKLAKRQSRTTEVIPLLPKNHEIRGGRRGKYRVGNLVKDGEKVRFYEGFHVLNNKPILIKEYLLTDKDFNQKESKERKEKFARFANVNLKNVGGQDFRLISPWDAIAPTNSNEKRCYLILEQSFSNGLTLSEYLAENGRMNCKQVRQILYQVLQTLWFLHHQKLRLSNEEIQQSLPHGNLSLDSLVIVENLQLTSLDEPQFFIYVGDLALWEDLFKPPNTKNIHHSVEKDLSDLGYVSFYLLSGTTVNQNTGENLDPKKEEQWPIVKDIALKRFIHHLLGIDKPFSNAFEARQALLASPVQLVKEEVEETTEANPIPANKKHSWRFWLTVLILGIIVGFVVQMIWFGWKLLLANKNEKVDILVTTTGINNSLKDVKKVYNGKVNYTTETDGVWSYIFNYRFAELTLEQEFKNRNSNLQNYNFSTTTNDLIGDIRSKKVDFALTNYIKNLPKDLKQEVVAYDGLVIFVAFSDPERNGNIPKSFQGKISLAQLRDLYRNGRIKNWQPPTGFKRIKLYRPIDNDRALKMFEKVVLQNNKQDITLFRNQILLRTIDIINQKNKAIAEQTRQINQKKLRISKRKIAIEQATQKIRDAKEDEKYILGEILKDFEDKKIVSIGFGFFSRIFGQCSVYPLAVGENGKEVQVLIPKNGNKDRPIYETMDLCADKGSYKPNIEAFNSGKYPLAVPLVVVYPKDSPKGERFAKLLLTNEGQSLLRAAGLVPVRELPDK